MTDNQESYMVFNEATSKAEAKKHYPATSDLLRRIEQLENQYQFLALRHNIMCNRVAAMEGYPQNYEKTTAD